MLVTDPVFANPDKWQWMFKVPQNPTIHYAAAVAGALLVLVIGKALAARKGPAAAH